MPLYYNITSESPTRLTLQERSHLPIIAIVIGLIGGFLLIFGLLGLLFGLSEGDFRHPEWVMICFGGLFLLGRLIVLDARDDNPKALIFDNSLQELHIHQKSEQTHHSAAIPYKNIQKFFVLRTSQGSGGDQRRRKVYVVFMQKTDRSLWNLSTFNDLASAQTFHRKIEQFFKREEQTQPEISIKPVFPSKFIQRYEYADRVEMSWRNKIHIRKIALIGILSCFWGLSLVGIQSGAGASNELFYFSLVLLLFSGIVVYGVFSDLTTTYGIEISRTGMSSLKNKRITHTVSLKDIAAISFDFSDQVGGKPLRVMTHEQQAILGTINTEDGVGISDITAVLKLATSKWELNIDRLDVVSRIHLEHYLEQDLKKYGATQVK